MKYFIFVFIVSICLVSCKKEGQIAKSSSLAKGISNDYKRMQIDSSCAINIRGVILYKGEDKEVVEAKLTNVIKMVMEEDYMQEYNISIPIYYNCVYNTVTCYYSKTQQLSAVHSMFRTVDTKPFEEVRRDFNTLKDVVPRDNKCISDIEVVDTKAVGWYKIIYRWE